MKDWFVDLFPDPVGRQHVEDLPAALTSEWADERRRLAAFATVAGSVAILISQERTGLVLGVPLLALGLGDLIRRELL